MKIFNMNKNFGNELEGIEEERGRDERRLEETVKFKSTSYLPLVKPLDGIPIITEKLGNRSFYNSLKSDKNTINRLSLEKTNYVNKDPQIAKQINTEMPEYVNYLSIQDEERKEKKFKKLFTANGKYASFAKQKCKK